MKTKKIKVDEMIESYVHYHSDCDPASTIDMEFVSYVKTQAQDSPQFFGWLFDKNVDNGYHPTTKKEILYYDKFLKLCLEAEDEAQDKVFEMKADKLQGIEDAKIYDVNEI